MFLLLAGLLASCSARYSPVFAGWGEWADPGAGELRGEAAATLDWADWPTAIQSIDGKAVGTGYKRARLTPGLHTVAYLYNPAEFGARPRGTAQVAFAQGHSYRFNIKLCFWCIPRKYAVWIDDSTTGRVVWGAEPDWPWWML